MMKCIFSMQISIGVFYKLILSSWVCITSHSQSTQNKFPEQTADKHKSFQQGDRITSGVHNQACSKNQIKFAISLQYLKENLKDEVYFQPDERQRLLQIDTITIGVWPGMPKLLKITSLLLPYLKKEVTDVVYFFACR